jgi:hypothetical protein
MSLNLNLNQIDGDDVSGLYKGVKSEYLPNVNVNTIHYNKNAYQIVKYVKNNINRDNVLSTGLFRSVIARNGKVLSFAPPKSMDTSDFINSYEASECYAEEFVEGTMINLFYDDNYTKSTEEEEEEYVEKSKWIITTKSNIGAKNSFFTNGHIHPEDTFQHMFLDACKHAKLDFTTLPKEYQYSFVLQHPRNRIVLDIKEPTLYIISVNHIDENNVLTRIKELDMFLRTNVKVPNSYECKDLREFEKEWENIDGENRHDYKEMGLVVVHSKTGNRTKFRNPHYEYVKVLRGNQPKLEFRFIELWQENRLQEYLAYFPECNTLFNEYWTKLSKFMDATFNNYVACYMLKRQALKEYPFEYRTHMYELHAMYKETLRGQNKVVTIPIAVEYFRSLPAAKLLFSLNYNMRPKNTDTESTRVSC